MSDISWRWVINWTNKMTRKHGPEVVDNEDGVTWDWGQALMRQVYGPDWMNNDQFYMETDTGPDDPVPDKVIDAAKAWEKNGHPSWATTRRGGAE